VWDTAGQEEYGAIAAMYYRDCQGVILVYDTTIHESFTRVNDWLKEVKNYVPDAVVYIVGNKMDLEFQRDIKVEAVQGWCNKNK
jgi:small GTP-binding protein